MSITQGPGDPSDTQIELIVAAAYAALEAHCDSDPSPEGVCRCRDMCLAGDNLCGLSGILRAVRGGRVAKLEFKLEGEEL